MSSRRANLSPEIVREYQKHFEQFDLDGDGVISIRELKIVFKKMGYRLSDREVEDIVRANDADNSGTLSFSEFIEAMPQSSIISDDEHRMANIRRKFMEYDKDGDGVVSMEEAHAILEKEFCFTREQSTELMRKYDKNGDGQLSYDEFARFYTKVKARAQEIERMFKEADKDGSGSVSVEEVKAMLRQLQIPDEEIETLVEIHDKNKDGELQYEEFVSFLMHT